MKFTWENVLVVIAGIIVVQKFLSEVWGINMLGKKIYKGAPLIWKWFMKSTIDRKDLSNKVDSIMAELKYNGGGSTKDMIRKLLELDEKKTSILKQLQHTMSLTSIRLDINDITNDRMIFRMDSFGACTFINETFLKEFGYTWRDIQNFNWESIIHHDDIDDVRDRWDRAIKTKSRYFGEQRIVKPNGEAVKVLVVGYPVVDGESGILKEFYGTIDIHNSN